MELLGQMVTLLNLLGTVRLFSIVSAPFQPAVCEGSNFSTYSTTLVIVCLFESSRPNGCDVLSHCGFDLHFPDGL